MNIKHIVTAILPVINSVLFSGCLQLFTQWVIHIFQNNNGFLKTADTKLKTSHTMINPVSPFQDDSAIETLYLFAAHGTN